MGSPHCHNSHHAEQLAAVIFTHPVRLTVKQTEIMKKTLLSIVCVMAFAVAGAQETDRRTRLENHLYYLASDSLHGRKAGSEDAAKARAYILEQWKEMGLEPFFNDGFEDPFDIFCNLVAVIPGCDPVLSNEYILLGAHYDHIGYKGDEICNGADDNASGSSALIEVARMLKENQGKLKRSVIIAAFDAEELGLFGSAHLASRMSADSIIQNVKCMMSLDMVGWYAKNGKLELLGAGTMKDGRKILEDNAQGLNLKIGKFETAIFTATDTRSFAQDYRVPTLHVYTGLKSPYHKPADDADLIDYDGLDEIACFISRVTTDMASDPEFGPSGKIATIHTGENKPFEVAVSGGFTTSSLSFPKASLTSGGSLGWTAGLTAQYNHKYMGYRIGAFYETGKAYFPDQSNLFSSKLTYRQEALEVPLTFIIQNRDQMVRFYLGAGANARYLFSSSLENTDCSTNNLQWGIHFMFGMKLGHLFIEDYFLNQANNMFKDGPAANFSITTCKIGWVF